MWGFSTYPWTPPIQSVNPDHPYHPSHILSKSSCPYPHISPLPPPHSYRPTPNHLHSYTPHTQTISIYHALPPQPRSHPPKDYKSTLCFLSFSNTPHIHLTIICSVLSRLCRFATFISQSGSSHSQLRHCSSVDPSSLERSSHQEAPGAQFARWSNWNTVFIVFHIWSQWS